MINCGLKAGLIDGHRTLGLSKARVQMVRRGLRHALPGGGRGSTTIRLAAAGLEPTQQIAAGPVVAWATAVWLGTVPPEDLRAAWRVQWPRFGLGMRGRQSVRGPAGAVITSLVEAGWRWPAWHTFNTAGGVNVRLDKV